jgi:hypothetical protein
MRSSIPRRYFFLPSSSLPSFMFSVPSPRLVHVLVSALRWYSRDRHCARGGGERGGEGGWLQWHQPIPLVSGELPRRLSHKSPQNPKTSLAHSTRNSAMAKHSPIQQHETLALHFLQVRTWWTTTSSSSPVLTS